MKFKYANEEWLKDISKNRTSKIFDEDLDIVIGAVANDTTMPILNLYLNGIYDEKEALKRLLPQKLKDQYAFKTEVCGVDASMNMKEIFSDVLANYDSEVIKLISEKYGFSEMESMRKFLYSETYEMLSDFELEMWEFSPLVILDMWENEKITGDPRNSVYIRGESGV